MTQPVRDRFMAKVDTSGGLFACWPWTGAVDEKGYGRFMLEGRNQRAHRVALALDGRPVPVGFDGCHACDNPPCVNPAHLWPGSRLENVRDASAKGRRASVAGERNPRARLTPSQVVEIRERASERRIDLAREFGVARSTIQSLITGGNWAVVR